MQILIQIYCFFFSRKILYPLNLHIYKLSMRGIGVLNSENSKRSGEDYLFKYLKNNYSISTIFDVGANNGNYSSNMSKIFPKAHVYSFEPNPKMYKFLNKISNKKIKTYNFGFSSRENNNAKIWDFYDDTTQPTSTLASNYKDVIIDLHKQKPVSRKIKLKTVDQFCKANGIKNIDFLKVDTEGNEFKVLQGAKAMLKTKKIKIIMLEFNEMNVYSRTFMRDIFKILENYNLYRLLPDGIVYLGKYRPKEHEIFAFQNIVALDKNIDLI